MQNKDQKEKRVSEVSKNKRVPCVLKKTKHETTNNLKNP